MITIQSLLLLPIGLVSYVVHFLMLDVFPHNGWTELFSAPIVAFGRVEAIALIFSITGLMYAFRLTIESGLPEILDTPTSHLPGLEI